jgi:hypothetical protein
MDACDLQLKIEIDPATCSATRKLASIGSTRRRGVRCHTRGH